MKTEYQLGLETILNNPKTSFLKNPKMIEEISKSAGMSMSQMIKTIGKSSKTANKRKEATDDEKSMNRLQSMAK
jgi:arsenate reductase-like glutaredoxin family protein